MIRVVAAEDQAMVLGALAALLSLNADIEGVARAQDGAVPGCRCNAERPDVLLSDIDLPGRTGLDLSGRFQAQGLAVRVLIVTIIRPPRRSAPCA